MRKSRPALFRGRHFREDIIVLCVRWYLRYPLSYRDFEEMVAERGLTVDHSTVARWVLHYSPILEKRIRREMRQPNRSWRVDETYIRVAGRWTYLYRAVVQPVTQSTFCSHRTETALRPKASCNLLYLVGFDPALSMWTAIPLIHR